MKLHTLLKTSWAKIVTCNPFQFSYFLLQLDVNATWNVGEKSLAFYASKGQQFIYRFSLKFLEQWFLTFLANYPFWWVWKPNYPQTVKKSVQKICQKSVKKSLKICPKKSVEKSVKKSFKKHGVKCPFRFSYELSNQNWTGMISVLVSVVQYTW